MSKGEEENNKLILVSVIRSKDSVGVIIKEKKGTTSLLKLRRL